MPNLQKIKQIAADKNLPLGMLAEQIGVTPTGLSKIMRDNTTTVVTLERIANVLQVSPVVFFDLSFDIGMVQQQSSAERQVQCNDNNCVTIPKEVLDMLAEKDRQLAEKDKLLVQYMEFLSKKQ